MAKVLVYYSLSGNTEAAAKAVAAGSERVSGTEVRVKEATEATEEDLRDCDAIAVGTYDAFSYMAGGLKDFFDRTYYPTQGQVTDKPYAAFVTHGGGGRAIDSVEKICGSFKLRKVADPVLIRGRPDSVGEVQLQDLGMKLTQAI